jgi:hypothetical protein
MAKVILQTYSKYKNSLNKQNMYYIMTIIGY